MDKLEDNHKHGCRKDQKNQVSSYSDRDIVRELERINEDEDLQLHRYHQDLIFNKFKSYYEKYENNKAHKIKQYYEEKIKRA